MKGQIMKQIACYALAAGLILSTGCSDERKATEVTPIEPPLTPSLSDQTKAITKDLTQQAEAAKEQATEKLAAMTEQAKTAAADITEKAQSAIKSFPVSKDEVLAEINQPIADLKAKVETLAQPELMAYASTYKDVLLEKKDQLAGLTSQLKGLAIGDILGEKGKAIKDQISQYTAQFNQLKERYGVYLDKLKSLGANISAFGI
jgi:polyhydroxyalkanoate synthesis regulator phasin